MLETKPKVLVVDDDAMICRLVARILDRAGFTVECAKDGFEAIQRLARNEYAVVILDLMMPRVDGFGVIDFLRRTKKETLQRVIVLTASSGGQIYDEPVAEVLQKPFDIHKLVEHARACSVEMVH